MELYPNNFSIWCDFIEREFLKKEFIDFLESGVVAGITSNPTIFKNAIQSSKSYDADKKKTSQLPAKQRYEILAIEDVRAAAKILLDTYKTSTDGLVSIEVPPYLADDTKGTIEEGKRLFSEINEPNVMIKIPATDAGYEAMEELIASGINVNATLVFSPSQAKECLRAFDRGNRKFIKAFNDQDLPRAVISVFVSRFDRRLDPLFIKEEMPIMEFGIMNASFIYLDICKANLPNVRCLFASTGVSDKEIDGSYYITKLLYENAINTAPMNAIKAFVDAWDTNEITPPTRVDILKYFSKVKSIGIDVEALYTELLEDGLRQFENAFDEILKMLEPEQVLDDAENKKKVATKMKTTKEKVITTRRTTKRKVAGSEDIPPCVIRLNTYLSQLIEFGGSDLHIKSDAATKGRVNGEIVTVDNEIFTNEEVAHLAQELLQDRFEEFYNKKNLDFMYKLNDDFRFRVNIFFQVDGISAAFRAIPTQLPTVKSLDLPEVIDTFSVKQRGLILVTGPTGCGKSTTLATMINLINLTSQRHIITIEDPVEFIYKDEQSIINQRAIGQSATTFSNALVAALREDPDVIMVGEMRDPETIRTAISAAETGHLVLSTLHTIDAKETIGRIISMFEGSEQDQIRKSLSSVLQAIVSQRLIRRKNSGRIAATEILVKNSRIEMLIADKRENEIKDAIEEGRTVYKSQSFNQALLDLYIKKVINYHEALRAATSASDLKILLDNYDAKQKIKEYSIIEDSEDEPIRIIDEGDIFGLKD